MSARVRLLRLRISGFRGAGAPIEVPLEEPLNIVYGPNGSGKSTILTAVEWALFPAESTKLKEAGIDERRSWQVSHVHTAGPPEVALTLAAGGADFLVTQRGLRAPCGEPPLACTYSDFRRLAFVHQETLRDFLVGQPGARQEAFGRLLGTGWAQDLAKALDRARSELRCDEADRTIATAEELLAAQMREVHRLLAEEQRRAAGAGLREPWREAARQVHEALGRQLEALCGKTGVPAPALPELEPLDTFPRRLGAALAALGKTGPALDYSALSSKRSALESARASYSQAADSLRRAQDELSRLVSQSGDLATLRRQIGELQTRRGQLQIERASLNRRLAVIQEAVAFFRETPGAGQCPVCEREVGPSFGDDLQRRLDRAVSAEDRRLQTALDEASKKLAALHQKVEQTQRLEAAVDSESSRLEAERRQLSEALDRRPAPDEDPAALAEIEIRRLSRELEAQQKSAAAWMGELSRIETEGRKMEPVGRILELQRRLRQLGEARQTPEWKAMVSAHEALARREQIFKLAGARAKALAGRLAASNLERVHRPVGETYRRLAARSDFPSVQIDAAKKYEVAVASEEAAWAPTALLNVTDLNSLALALVTGMSTVFRDSTDLDFLVFDDPSQGMDADVASRLGAVLSDLSATVQVVVATPDAHLFEQLCRSPRRKNVIRLTPRDPGATTLSVHIESISH